MILITHQRKEKDDLKSKPSFSVLCEVTPDITFDGHRPLARCTRISIIDCLSFIWINRQHHILGVWLFTLTYWLLYFVRDFEAIECSTASDTELTSMLFLWYIPRSIWWFSQVLW